MNKHSVINVTKSFLPPQYEYLAYLNKIWESTWLTNSGPLLLELEEKLKKHLGVKHLFIVNNGTIALQIAIKACNLQGEVITTPFSYVATTSAISWQECTPVFADIEESTLCIDPSKISEKITARTTGILATHVYGGASEVNAIQKIADKYQLKVIYDAAHAFDTRYKGQSLLNFGDISTLSFHATKLFHTVEGGAIITNDDSLAAKISYMRNFGHKTPEEFYGVGINGKNSEFHAAMGLAIFPYLAAIKKRRKEISELYDKLLLNHSAFRRPKLLAGLEYNYAYYAIILANEELLLKVLHKLNSKNIFPRRYFYPSLNTLNYVVGDSVPIAEEISKKILCLPIYYELSNKEVEFICENILSQVEQEKKLCSIEMV